MNKSDRINILKQQTVLSIPDSEVEQKLKNEKYEISLGSDSEFSREL